MNLGRFKPTSTYGLKDIYAQLTEEPIATNEVVLIVEEITTGQGEKRTYKYNLQYALVDKFLY